MSLNNKLIQVTLSLIMGLIATSCIEENVAQIQKSTSHSDAIYTSDDPGYHLAQALSIALKDHSIRQFVHDKVEKRFDGDLNFLFALEQNEAIGSNNSRSTSFKEALFGKAHENLRVAIPLKEEPLLQIALRFAPSIEQVWDSENYHPIVVYLPYGTNLDMTSTLPAFNQEGHFFNFEVDKFPSKPIIVISHNERVKNVSRSKIEKLRSLSTNSELSPDDGCILSREPIMIDEENYYYTYTDLNCGGSGPADLPGSIDGQEDTNENCHREGSNLYDHISRVKFTNMEELNKAESYISGAPEIFFFVFTGSQEGYLQSIKKWIPKVDRSEWKDCPLFSDCYTEWHYPDLEVMYWDKEVFGEILKYQWFEHDEGDPVKFTTTFNSKLEDGTTVTNSFEVNISSEDKDLGYSLVYFCEDATSTKYKVYETGSLFYALELR